MIKQIEIKTPIWKTRSVGLNISDCRLNDYIELDIAYKNKAGEKIYPFIYFIPVNNIIKYPVKKINANISVHIVPIKDLLQYRKLLNTNNSNNTNNLNKEEQNMLFDSKTVKQVIKDNDKRKDENSIDKRPNIPAGENILTITDCEAKISKKSGNRMIMITMTKQGDFKPLQEIFMLEGNGSDIAKQRLVELLWNGFNYEMKQCENEQEAIKEVLKNKNKEFKAAVKIQQGLYSFQDKNNNNENKMIVTEKSIYSYAGSINDNDFYVNPNKLVTELSSDDKAKLVAFNELKGTQQTISQPSLKEQGRSIGDTKPSQPASSNTEVTDDLPFN